MLECMDCVDAGKSPGSDNWNIIIPEILSLYHNDRSFFKGRRLPTLSDGLSKARKVVADKHLLSERKYPLFLAKVMDGFGHF
jgi:hypothetical protein